MHIHKWAPWSDPVEERVEREWPRSWQDRACTVCHKIKKRWI